MAESVFRRVHRIRKTEEARARHDKRVADEQRDACEAVVIALDRRLAQSHQSFAGSPGLIAHHHSYALRAELQRRGAEQALREANERVIDARRQVLQRSVEARSVELVAEAVELQVVTAQRHAEAKELDEVGAQRFARKAS